MRVWQFSRQKLRIFLHSDGAVFPLPQVGFAHISCLAFAQGFCAFIEPMLIQSSNNRCRVLAFELCGEFGLSRSRSDSPIGTATRSLISNLFLS
jgi:hypothetical protein